MQHPMIEAQSRSPDRSSSSHTSDSIPEDWFLNLQRIVERHIATCQTDEQAEFLFSVYTWYLDHQTMRLCRAPKIAVLGGDPTEWKEDLLYPWRWILRSEDKVFLDVVQPSSPRADIEEHIAHVILTQGYTTESSVLLSMDFPADVALGPSVIIRFAVVAPKTCTVNDLMQEVPLLSSFALNRIDWEHPTLALEHEEFPTWSGLGLQIKILADDNTQDSLSLLQGYLPSIAETLHLKVRPIPCRFTKKFDARIHALAHDHNDFNEILEDENDVFNAMQRHASDSHASVHAGSKQDSCRNNKCVLPTLQTENAKENSAVATADGHMKCEGIADKPSASLTDEFLQAIAAANNAQEEMPPIDPLDIDAQPVAFQTIWARFPVSAYATCWPYADSRNCQG